MYNAGNRVLIHGIKYKEGKQYNGRYGTVIEVKQRTKRIQGRAEPWHDIRVLLDGATEPRWFSDVEVSPSLWDDSVEEAANRITTALVDLDVRFDIWPSGTMIFDVPGSRHHYIIMSQDRPPTLVDMLFAQEYVLLREGVDL